MKKILALLLVLVLAVSLAVAGFAATSGTLQDGDNQIELPYKASEASTYTYTATQTGTLYIMATSFGYSYKGGAYQDNAENMDEWEMYTSFTVNGEALSGHYYGSVQVVQGQTYTFSWSLLFKDDFGWNATLNLSYTPDLLPVQGTADFPVVLRVEDCPTQSISIPAGGSVYYTLYDFDGGHLLITGKNACVIFTYINNETMQMETRTYEAVNGVVSVPMPTAFATLQIGNKGATDAVFAIDCIFPEGIRKNPAQLVLGENVATTRMDDFEGYYFTWTAPRSGKLTLTFPNDGWYYSIHNETTNQFQGSGTSADENPVNPVVVEVKKGDVLLININSFKNSDLSIPGGDVTFTAAAEYGHEYQVTDSRAATCCAEGYTTYTCIECGHSYTEQTQIDPKNHTALKQIAEYTAPTCEADGCKPTWQCDGCGGVYSNQTGTLVTTVEEQRIPAAGHAFTEWEDLGNGTKKHTCSVCGFEEVADTQCQHTNTQITEGQAADCLNPGKEGDTVCTDCGEVVEAGKEIPAVGHSFVLGEQIAGSCCSKSVRIYACTACDESYTEEGELDPDVHNALTQVCGDTAATCAAEGRKATWKCEDCGGLFADAEGKNPTTEAQQKIAKLDHKEGSWVTTKQPTETEAGQKEQRCNACNEVMAREEIPAIGQGGNSTMLWVILAAVLVLLGVGAVVIVRKKK